MSGSAPAGQSTTTKTVTPTGNIADYNSAGLTQGGNLYNGPPLYSPLNGDQTSGLNEIARIAGSGNQTANQMYDLAGQFGQGQFLNSNIANPGLQKLAGNDMNTQTWQDALKGLGTGAMNNPANPYLDDFSKTGATGSTQDMLMKSARGDYLSPDTNPWLKSTYDQGMSGVQNSVTSAMAGAGRFGSGAMAGALGSGATNLANEIYGTNYQNERTRQQQAQGLIGQLQSSDRGQQQQAAEAMGQLYNTGTQLGISANTNAGQLAAGDRTAVGNALSQLSGNYNTGLNATTSMAQLSPALGLARYNDMNQLIAAGKGFQDDANAQAAEPWKRLSDYMGVSQGMNPGTSEATSSPYFQNSFGQGLTGAAGTAALLSQIFGGTGTNGQGASLASQLGTGAGNLYSKFAGLFGGGSDGINNYVNNFTDPLGTDTGGNLSSAAFPDLYVDPATGQRLF